MLIAIFLLLSKSSFQLLDRLFPIGRLVTVDMVVPTLEFPHLVERRHNLFVHAEVALEITLADMILIEHRNQTFSHLQLVAVSTTAAKLLLSQHFFREVLGDAPSFQSWPKV